MLFLFVYYVFIETKQCYLKEINMKQVDEDMLIIKAMVGDDFERMNNLIVEM